MLAKALMALMLSMFSSHLLACQCVNYENLGEKVASSDVVFVALITSVNTPGPSSKYRQIGYETQEILKGETRFPALQTHNNSCGTPFEEGLEYLIFASNDGVVSTCSGARATTSSDGFMTEGRLWVNAIHDFDAGVTQDLVAPWYFKGSEDRCVLFGEFVRPSPSYPVYLSLSASGLGSQSRGTHRMYLGFTVEARNTNNAAPRPLELHVGTRQIDIPPAKLRVVKGESRESLGQMAAALREASTDSGGSNVRFDASAVPVRMSSDAGLDGAVSQFQQCLRGR